MEQSSPALDALLSRQSVGAKHLREPGPDSEQMQCMVEAALRAPDHAGLVPFRFAVVRGAARDRLGQLFTQAAIDGGKSDADAQIDGERARRAPVTVAVIARIDSGHPLVPAHEQWACVGGALTNLLNAAHAMDALCEIDGHAGMGIVGRGTDCGSRKSALANSHVCGDAAALRLGIDRGVRNQKLHDQPARTLGPFAVRTNHQPFRDPQHAARLQGAKAFDLDHAQPAIPLGTEVGSARKAGVRDDNAVAAGGVPDGLSNMG